jgi:hypothetical protein
MHNVNDDQFCCYGGIAGADVTEVAEQGAVLSAP